MTIFNATWLCNVETMLFLYRNIVALKIVYHINSNKVCLHLIKLVYVYY